MKQWVRTEGLKKNIHYSQLELVGGKVVSYGSYKLEVVDKESDLDLLCVVPKHVSRDDFFCNLYSQLNKKAEVQELRQLASAYVPVIKLQYRGVEVDLTMARLNVDRIPEVRRHLTFCRKYISFPYFHTYILLYAYLLLVCCRMKDFF